MTVSGPSSGASAAVSHRARAETEPGPPDAVLPEYLRLPDAEATRR